MMNRLADFGALLTMLICAAGCSTASRNAAREFDRYTLGYDAPVNAPLQSRLERIDADLRAQFVMTTEQTAVGLLDLSALRLAMIHPDREEYAASVPKVGILLAYFQLRSAAAANLDAQTRH